MTEQRSSVIEVCASTTQEPRSTYWLGVVVLCDTPGTQEGGRVVA